MSVLGIVRNDRERQCVGLLESVAASSYDPLEILILADATSTTRGQAIKQLLAAHPSVAMSVLPPAGGGLAARRNLLAEQARGEHVLVLTAQGGVFPSSVARLVAALDADRAAFFAYAMSAVCDERVSVGLRGSLPWEPHRLRRENWIDAPALIRRACLLELGGYSLDPALRGLEDFDLWCRFAEAGGHGVHAPQVLGWHPPGDNAQPVDVAAVAPAIRERMRERCPRVFADSPATDERAGESARRWS